MSRAILPTRQAGVDRGNVRIAYEVYESEAPTIFMVPPAPITHSRIFKGQIAYLARHFRVVTMDGRGNGKSGRPKGQSAYLRSENELDILAVLDATGTEEAILMGHCTANWWTIDVAAEHPDRVRALIALSPGVPYLGKRQPHWVEIADEWDETPTDPSGWHLCNRHTIVNEHRRWIDFFFDALLPESHSTKQYEDSVGWAMESTGDILADAEEAEGLDPPSRQRFEAQCRGLNCPVLVIHGDRDMCQRVERGRALAEITSGELVVIEGGGHLTLARDPVKVNRSIKKFIDFGVRAA